MSQFLKGKGKARDPQANLFHQSTPAASNVSLTGTGVMSPPKPSGPRTPSHRQQPGEFTALMSPAVDRNSPATQHQTAFRAGGGRTPAGLGDIAPLKMRQESTRATDRTDAQWAEMQATLEDVELSASDGTRVFGPDHDRKLGGLRAAQIALAQAWARSEADEAIETTMSTDGRPVKDAAAGGMEQRGKGDAAAPGSTAVGSARPGSAGTERLGAKMEEETEVDILLARKRREANDRYFSRVNQGVLDVVARLEEVAVAMRAVEQESKHIWDDGGNGRDQESVAGSSKT